MIQRVQTLYLLLAVAASVACLCLKIGTAEAGGITIASEYNLWATDISGARSFTTWPLFAVLTLSAALGVYAIFAYSNRKAQARLCLFNTLLILGWYIIYIALALIKPFGDAPTDFTPTLAAALPAIAAALHTLARRAILADERLVRSVDRIR